MDEADWTFSVDSGCRGVAVTGGFLGVRLPSFLDEKLFGGGAGVRDETGWSGDFKSEGQSTIPTLVKIAARELRLEEIVEIMF